MHSHDLGLQLVPSAQANWSEVQGGREGEERLDDALCLLEEVMVGSNKVLRSKGTVKTASGGGDKECCAQRRLSAIPSYRSTASLPSFKTGCRTCVDLRGCRVKELLYLSAWVFEMLLLISSAWWSPVRSFSCTSFRWMLKMLAITKNCSTPIL